MRSRLAAFSSNAGVPQVLREPVPEPGEILEVPGGVAFVGGRTRRSTGLIVGFRNLLRSLRLGPFGRRCERRRVDHGSHLHLFGGPDGIDRHGRTRSCRFEPGAPGRFNRGEHFGRLKRQ